MRIRRAYNIAKKPEINKLQNRRWDLNHLKSNIHPYSAKNNSTNKNLEYSTLKPLTSSLSPSAKSNGARLVSARTTNKKIKTTGKNSIALEKGKDLQDRENPKNKGKNKIK